MLQGRLPTHVYKLVSGDSLIHADIFFFVSTIAVAVLVILAIIVTVYLVRALRAIEERTEDVKESFLYRLLFRTNPKTKKDAQNK